MQFVSEVVRSVGDPSVLSELLKRAAEQPLSFRERLEWPLLDALVQVAPLQPASFSALAQCFAWKELRLRDPRRRWLDRLDPAVADAGQGKQDNPIAGRLGIWGILLALIFLRHDQDSALMVFGVAALLGLIYVCAVFFRANE